MSVSYTFALRQSISRTKRLLFSPFRLEVWMRLGFAAFLSEYLSRWHGGRSPIKRHAEEPLGTALSHAAAFLLHPVWGTLAIIVLCVVIIAVIALMWISSRGKFVFLDDVAHERSAIVEPWKRFGALANSLFGFWLTLVALTVLAMVMVSLPLIPSLLAAIAAGEFRPLLAIVAAAWWVSVMVPILLLAAFVHVLLFHFVVPIMYRDGLGVLAAWGKFLSLFRRHVLAFIGFGVFFLLLMIGMIVLVVVVGFSTCCVGFVLVALPYISSVVLLPIEVTFRGLGPDFLAQFGREWSTFPEASPTPLPESGGPAVPGGM